MKINPEFFDDFYPIPEDENNAALMILNNFENNSDNEEYNPLDPNELET